MHPAQLTLSQIAALSTFSFLATIVIYTTFQAIRTLNNYLDITHISPPLPHSHLPTASDTELVQIKHHIATRTENDIKFFHQVDTDLAKLFHDIVPSAPKLLITILAYNPLVLLVIFIVKHWYNRPRPFDVDQTINNLPSRLTNNPSFPSGHSVTAASMAKHLTYLYPNKADDLHDLSQQIGQSRITGGVHYPSDVRGGQQMVQDIWWL